jgi:hypothetical protein
MFRLLSLIFAGVVGSAPIAAAETSGDGALLSAFFGLDDSRQIRIRTAVVCDQIAGNDGMPVIFAQEVDPETLDAEDFRIVRASGRDGRVDCVTLRPADDLGELRTALLVGQYGSEEDPPLRVEIVGDVLSLDGLTNFKGGVSAVIPLSEGPTLILAEALRPNEWSLGGEGDCPREGLRGIVRAVWVGGITKPGGDEIDEREMQQYRVEMRTSDGQIVEVTPFAVGDLSDNDNNHDLCLDVEGEALRVSFPAGALTDPNEDLNPATSVEVTQLPWR